MSTLSKSNAPPHVPSGTCWRSTMPFCAASGAKLSATMRRAIAELVPAVDTPLCIDSTNPKAVEAGLRLYPGRALFNSISLEEERIRAILPIAAKYGAMLVLLPMSLLYLLAFTAGLQVW